MIAITQFTILLKSIKENTQEDGSMVTLDRVEKCKTIKFTVPILDWDEEGPFRIYFYDMRRGTKRLSIRGHVGFTRSFNIEEDLDHFECSWNKYDYE